MKKILLALSALLFAVSIAAQNPTAYFMEGTTFRSQLNPAFAPRRGYVNIPVLGGLDINVSGNLSLDKILFPRGGKLVTLVDGSVTAADALGGLSTNNLLGTASRINIIGFGAFTRNQKNFWSFDLNARVNADAGLPYSLFEFLKQGADANISGIGVAAESFIEAGFNYSMPINDKLYIGIRAKFLVGVARARLQYDRFNVSLHEDEWRIDASGELDITAAGINVEPELNSKGKEVYKFNDIDMKPTSPAGYGFAVDLGATYDILSNLQASLAINDLGFISWGEKHNLIGSSMDDMSFTGAIINDGYTEQQPKFDLDILEFQQQEARSTTRMLRASINAGIEYKVWRNKIGLGLLYTARIWEYQTMHNITGSVNFHPTHWFTLSGSYSVIDNRGGAIGLAMNICPGWINFFVATDMATVRHTPQWVPIKQSIMNVSLGLGVPIGKRSLRNARVR